MNHNPCSLHLVSFFSSKHTEPFIENSPSLWLTINPDIWPLSYKNNMYSCQPFVFVGPHNK